MNLYEQYESLCSQEKELKRQKEELQIAIYTKNADKFNSKEEGTVNVEEDGFKVSVIKKINYTVDQTLASVIGVGFINKFSLDKSAYKNATGIDRVRIDECLTTKAAKPTFKIERL